jgi:hypothetical protein
MKDDEQHGKCEFEERRENGKEKIFEKKENLLCVASRIIVIKHSTLKYLLTI